MHEDIVHIVGECFTACADDHRVRTLDRLIGSLESPTAPSLGARLVAGQGVTAADWARLVDEVGRRRPDLTVVERPNLRPSWLGTEKSNIHNVLVADLRRDGEDFVADLRVHPANSMLVDRGDRARHLPGMLEVEACLQMAMTTTAHHLVPPGDDTAFITTGTDIRFDGFLFPLPATVRLTVERRTVRDDGRVDLALSTRIVQSGRIVTRMSFTSGVMTVAAADAAETRQLDGILGTIHMRSTIERTAS